MRRALRWSARILGALALLAALAAWVGYFTLRNTIASPSGTLAIPGLSAPVEVIRDKEGVPHIFAKTTDDMYAALGFVHAQDRLWQMELLRRTGQGRLSEMLGERTFGTDIFLRTLDLYGHAERSLSALPPEVKATLDAYARGVNAYLNRPLGLFEPRLPPEFLILRHTPEPWKPADSVVAIKMMALQLSTNINQEIARLTYAAQGLGPADIEDLMPPDADEHPPALPAITELYPLRPPGPPRKQAALDIADMIGTGASNNWVVSGRNTKSGKPLLANDPHLRLGAPAIWHFAHLALEKPGAEPINMVGGTLAGVPAVVLGRTDTLAWGFTNTGPDVQDIFIEKIKPDDPKQYLTPDGWRPFEVEQMSIVVKGLGTRVIERRRTRHGPVLPGFYRNLEGLLGEGHVAALQWTALSDDDTTVGAGMFDEKLRTIADYFERMRMYVVPMQSMVVADSTGQIGMIAPGRVPIRDPANKVAGRMPVPGWDPIYDWKGYIKFEDLPRFIDPPAGAIGTANARIVPQSYPYHLTFDWDEPFRQQRLNELILERTGHDVASMRAAQMDVLSPAAARLRVLMVAAAQAGGQVDDAVLDMLTTWDGTMHGDVAEPLIFTAWLRESVRAIYSDDLGAAFGIFFDARASAMIRLLEGRTTGRDWCDDRTTPDRESCPAILARALGIALKELEGRYGPDRKKWRWDVAHFAQGEHRPFGGVAMLAPYFNVEMPSPGGTYTLNRGKTDFGDEPPFANRHASSMRAIYDFADLEHSLFIHTTGQSGNPMSPQYRSFAKRWARGDYIEIPTKREAIDKIAVGTWRLTPP